MVSCFLNIQTLFSDNILCSHDCLFAELYIHVHVLGQSVRNIKRHNLDVTFLTFHANSRLQSNETTNRMQIKIILKLNALILTAT